MGGPVGDFASGKATFDTILGDAETKATTNSNSRAGFTPEVEEALGFILPEILTQLKKTKDFTNDNSLVADLTPQQLRAFQVLTDLSTKELNENTNAVAIEAVGEILGSSGSESLAAFLTPVREQFLEGDVPQALGNIAGAGLSDSSGAEEAQDVLGRNYTREITRTAAEFKDRENQTRFKGAELLTSLLQGEKAADLNAANIINSVGQALQEQKQNKITGKLSSFGLGNNAAIAQLGALPKVSVNQGDATSINSQKRIDLLIQGLAQAGAQAAAGAAGG